MGFGSIHPRLVQGDCVVRTATATSVAVIGMACRLPGGIDSPQRLWEALLRGDDLVGEIPADRWDANVYYDPEPGVPGRSVSRWGAFADAEKAREARTKVERAGLKTYTQVVDTKDGKRTRVRVGPFTNRAEADKAAARIKALDLSASVLTL